MSKFLLATLFSIIFFLTACSGKNETAGGVVEDQGIVAIIDKNISGVSQKGPFVSGASITLLEMDEKYNQTGKAFYANIINDKGEFSIEKISLDAPFATLIVNGYYKNEVSGETSNGMIQLKAISDLSKRETVNINLLTHLEYKRVLALLDSGIEITKAKEKVEREILAAFDISLRSADKYFEDMNIFETDMSDAALLAISVLTQGDLGEGDFTERLTKLSEDLFDGVLDNDTLQAEMADFASTASLESIRINVEKWNPAETAPDFEKFVNRFWWHNFELGDCTTDREGELAQNKNPLSIHYKEWYECSDGAWIVSLKVDSNAVGEGFDAWYYGKNSAEGHSYGKDCITDHRVLTEYIDPCNGSGGYWWYYTVGDSVTINWGPEENLQPGNDIGDNDLSHIIEACKGICGKIHTPGYSSDKDYTNFVVGLSLVDDTKNGENVQKWRGICLEYAYTFNGLVTLFAVPSKETNDLYAHQLYTLPQSSKKKVLNISWNEFTPSMFTPAQKRVTIMETVQNFARIVIQFDNGEGGDGSFSITKVGAYGTCGK